MRFICSKCTVAELNEIMTKLVAVYGDMPVIELIKLGGIKNAR